MSSTVESPSHYWSYRAAGIVQAAVVIGVNVALTGSAWG